MARLRQCKMTEGCIRISQPRQSIMGAENQCHIKLLSVIIPTAPLEYEKLAKVRRNASQNTIFISVTAPKHDLCFLARFREPRCVELFLIYLPIFLRSLRVKNRRILIVFISVDLIKKLTKKVNFLPHLQKIRKSVDF